MPVQSASPMDPLDRIARFKTSPIHEMLSVLETLSYSWSSPRLTRQAVDKLGEEFLTRLRTLYGRFEQGCDFGEIPIEFADHEDVEGFLDYVSSLTDREISYFILGRRLHRDEIPKEPNSGNLGALLRKRGINAAMPIITSDLSWADDLTAIRDELHDLWSRYWNEVFRHEIDVARRFWEQSVADKRRIIGDRGASALFLELTDCDPKKYTEFPPLPDPLPEGSGYDVVEFIPVCRLGSPHAKVYYGWGKASVLYNCRVSEDQSRELEAATGSILKTFRSLGDENRLKILQLIAHREKSVNGKMIAKSLELSPSVVSRHLAQLKDGGLIEEFSPDNRAITYAIRMDRIRSLSDLLEFAVTQSSLDR